MDRFIHDENLTRFRKLLAQTTDQTKRCQIERLIAEEEAKDSPINKTKN